MSPIPTLRPLGETLGTEICGITNKSVIKATKLLYGASSDAITAA
jgi:hypothetical protein